MKPHWLNYVPRKKDRLPWSNRGKKKSIEKKKFLPRRLPSLRNRSPCPRENRRLRTGARSPAPVVSLSPRNCCRTTTPSRRRRTLLDATRRLRPLRPRPRPRQAAAAVGRAAAGRDKLPATPAPETANDLAKPPEVAQRPNGEGGAASRRRIEATRRPG
jgi:hypothetical protein